MQDKNPNIRLEAFCDGVFAIAITLLVIEIKIPESSEIKSTTDLLQALMHIIPSTFAYLLSFVVILITWVNHHNNLKLVNKSCNSFLYANGALLLTVAFLPYPTSLQGEFLLTDHAAPAVVLFDCILAVQAVAWILVTHSILHHKLARSEAANREIRKNRNFGYAAALLYGVCAWLAWWFPHGIFIFTSLTWIFWLIMGINIKHEELS